MKQKKQQYVSPQIEVIRMENEGVIASSVNNINNIPMSKSTYGRKRSYNNATTSELEDLINDILTVEN